MIDELIEQLIRKQLQNPEVRIKPRSAADFPPQTERAEITARKALDICESELQRSYFRVV